MRMTASTFLLAVFCCCDMTRAEVPLLSADELKSKATLVVVGKVRAVYSTTEKSDNYRDTLSVAEIAVVNVEKGFEITTGDTVYAHYWNKRWIGKGRPEPGSSGHLGVAKDDLVRAHLVRKEGTYHAMLPNGFAKLKAEDVEQPSKSAASNLQGTWDFVYYEEKGLVEQPGTKQFVISDNKLDFRAGGESRIETAIEVDAVQSPKHFTQKFKDGQVYRSILKRVGDLLILCGNRDKDRPTEFAGGTDKGGEFFIVLKRSRGMTEKKPRWWLLAIPVAFLIAVLICVLALQLRSGIRVTVENTGSTPLNSVVLHVTGVSYNLGDIAPGASATARVTPTSESHLEIEFTDVDGQTQRLDADGYFESGYRGTIRVSIKDGVIDKHEEDIKLW